MLTRPSFTALLICTLASTLSAAEEPAKTAAQTEAESKVQQDLLKPLAKREQVRSHMSRARLPPSARRVRITDPVALRDDKGKEFIRFAIDNKWGLEWDDDDAPPSKNAPRESWTLNVVTGCLYPASGEMFVKYGNAYRDSNVLLGKKTQVAEGQVCTPDAAKVAAKN